MSRVRQGQLQPIVLIFYPFGPSTSGVNARDSWPACRSV